jgi:hypothetical protein
MAHRCRTIASCGFLQQKQEPMLVKYAIQSRTSVGSSFVFTATIGIGYWVLVIH